jgi:hypothetical protein
MSDNENGNRIERSAEVRNARQDLRIEMQMRREEMAHEREMHRRRAQKHYAFKDEVNEKVRLLLTAQVIMAKGMEQLRASLRELSESQKHTDERLGVLVQMMDSFIRERNRNGSGEQPQA